jgi:hypothetical protein
MCQGEYYKRGYQEGRDVTFTDEGMSDLSASDRTQHVQLKTLGNIRSLAEL